jgi:hypothetical protein
MMTTRRTGFARRFIRFATVLASGAAVPGFVESCDDRLIGLTRFFDPCGTFLANCAPGDFEVNNAEIGDYCVDPACTVPGGCNDLQPLGTITDVCP